MAGENISKEERDEAIGFLEDIRKSLPVKQKVKINFVESYLTKTKYGLVYEHHQENVFTMLKDKVPVFENDSTREIINNKDKDLNFILEGDNLHSLYLLQKTHKKSIDCIYIDPPYNTGAKDWKYNNNFVDKNDTYRHSKWLSMMAERLKIAKKLLKEDGVLICAIDENELATLSLLLEDLFGIDYRIDTICIVHNPRGVQGDNFSYTNEYALFVYKKGKKVITAREIEDDEIDWRDLRDNGHESLRTDASTCFYSINVKDGKIIGFGDNKTHDLDFHPRRNELNGDGSISIFPIDKSGIEHKWRYNRESVVKIQKLLRVVDKGKGILDIELGKNYGTYKTVWVDKKYDSNENGTKLINDMVPGNGFDFPKSLYNVYDCLYAVVKEKPNATVLDFFAGSGTTGHALLLMNKLIGGNRKFILCTNNDVGAEKEEEFKKEFPNLIDANGQIETNSKEFQEFGDKYGIARSVTWPRVSAAIKGYISKSGSNTILYEEKLPNKIFANKEKYLSIKEKRDEVINKANNEFDSIKEEIDGDKLRITGTKNKETRVDGLGGNCVYYKTSFVEKNSEENDLSDLLLPSIYQLICLKEMHLVPKEQVIFKDEDYEKLANNLSKYSKKTVYVSPYIFIDSDFRQNCRLNGVELKQIPQTFYEYELKEVGEL